MIRAYLDSSSLSDVQISGQGIVWLVLAITDPSDHPAAKVLFLSSTKDSMLGLVKAPAYHSRQKQSI